MATAALTPVAPVPVAPFESVWRAPLFPVALAVTAGIVLDRYFSPSIHASLLALAAGLVAWLASLRAGGRGLPLLYLAVAGVAFGAAYHHFRRDVYPADDIATVAPAEPMPAFVRGVIDDEPNHTPAVKDDPLRSMDKPESSSTVLRITHLRQRQEWVPFSGRLRLQAPGDLTGLHVGDEVEAVGRLSLIAGPFNPGEFDFAAFNRDRGVRAQLIVAKTADGVMRLSRGWPATFSGWLAVVRGWGQGVLGRCLPSSCSGVAMALLLGDGSPMTAADWEKYVRTGVIHVLAISGQHLVVLAMALWWVMRLLGVRQRYAATVIALFLFGYALLTGGRPPALRSAVTVAAVCGGLLLRRRTLAANSFALAWLVVALLNPMDLFNTGCQLSFLSVAILLWGFRFGSRQPDDPLDRLIEASRPAWQRVLLGVGRAIGESYLVSMAIWLAVTPLAASRYNMISPIGIILGPPLTLLTSVALLAGFPLLVAAAVWEPLAHLFAPVVAWSLTACEWLVDVTDRWPVSHVYVGEVPEWWLWPLYLALLAALTQPWLRQRRPWLVAAALGWLCVGLIGGAARLPADELRCTFLAVGHGGCTVLELPDGRTLLYDAGAIGGPDVARRQIAPFLWNRGVRRIDEVFLSHADLDHFNGLASLLDRFAVGRITCTPTFADKDNVPVRHTLARIEQGGIPVRVVKAGDRLAAGAVSIEVLHPPARGPDGNENSRSLVLLVRHGADSILLTGDLEGTGLERVLAMPPLPVDVMMAPHHGSLRSNGERLALWARPRVVVSCQGPPRGSDRLPDVYRRSGARTLGTFPHGAVTVRSRGRGLVIETYVTRDRLTLRPRGEQGP
jgi:competence protein ComEC